MEQTKSTLEDQLAQSLMINGVIAAMPKIVELYPQLENFVNMAEKKLQEYMDEEKMIVLSKKNGKIFALVMDKKVPFTIDNNFDIEVTSGNTPILKTFEKNEWKEKLLNNVIVQTLKERYEKLDPNRVVTELSPDFVSSFMKAVPK